LIVGRDAYLGIDLGTSGCRVTAIDNNREIITEYNTSLPSPNRDAAGRAEQQPELWWQALCESLSCVTRQLTNRRVKAIAVDGTSSTLLICDRQGHPLQPAMMYDDTRASVELHRLQEIAPADSPVLSPSSSLAKALYLCRRIGTTEKLLFLHQSDWLAGRLSGRFGVSDYNNALKLGYDPVNCRWPDWLGDLDLPADAFPQVFPPATDIARIDRRVADLLGLDRQARVITGTTDSTASVLASGISQPGEAVTSLGTTLVIKMLSKRPLFAAAQGVYSHRLGDLWLVGGASNSGGGVLEAYFSRQQMTALTPALEPGRPTGLDYYPLARPGERFPINDPHYPPRIAPIPQQPVRLFQGLLEGIANIERCGYSLLKILGAPDLRQVYTLGGGALNMPWQQIRQQALGVPVLTSRQQQAAYGSALLALRGVA